MMTTRLKLGDARWWRWCCCCCNLVVTIFCLFILFVKSVLRGIFRSQFVQALNIRDIKNEEKKKLKQSLGRIFRDGATEKNKQRSTGQGQDLFSFAEDCSFVCSFQVLILLSKNYQIPDHKDSRFCCRFFFFCSVDELSMTPFEMSFFSTI